MRSTRVIIHKQNLVDNFRTIKSIAPNSSVMAIVKANAYGHGIVECSRILEEGGAGFFGVAFPEEGIQLREAGIKKPILVLIPVPIEDSHLYSEYDLQAVGKYYDRLEAISDAAVRRGKKVNTNFLVNTGMNRDGNKPENVEALLTKVKSLPGIQISGLGTHFATSDSADPEYVKKQLGIFNTTLSDLHSKGWEFEHIHCANSAAIINYPEAHYNMVRPGISLYGYNTSNMNPGNPVLKPVLELKSNVIFFHTLQPGDSVGYSRKFIAEKQTNIAAIPIGYGDGAFCSLSNNVECLIGGKRYPIVGSVCMDQIFVNMGSDTASPGDEVVLIGSQGEESIYVQELADKLGTIPYEILSAIQARVPRIYI